MRLKEQSSPAAEPTPAKPVSESSWGELQAAGGEDEGGEGGGAGGAEASEGGENSNSGAGDGEPRDSNQEMNQLAGQQQQQQQELQETDGVSGGDSGGVARETEATAADNMVGGDVVMVSPLDQNSDGGFDAGEGGRGGGGGGGGEGGDRGSENGYGEGEGDGEVEVERRPNLRALMTMLVVSLRMQRLVHWVVRKRCLDGLSEENLVDLLAALEVMKSLTVRLTDRRTDRPADRPTGGPTCCVWGFCLGGGV